MVTGSTAVDAVQRTAVADPPARDPRLALLEQVLDERSERLVLVTAHRRESWGEPPERVLRAVRAVVDRHPDVRVLLPPHPNPAVRPALVDVLGGHERIVVTGPLDHSDLVRALRRAALVLTDSGGLPEEAPSFGVPRAGAARQDRADVGGRLGLRVLVGTHPVRVLARRTASPPHRSRSASPFAAHGHSSPDRVSDFPRPGDVRARSAAHAGRSPIIRARDEGHPP
ncbi:UDP-N-acetylglucosamine 2-epimerase [Saccharothrix yanglingensis]|uniref:UDP-N-acetylglucosamine 2-epimerase n=1 Tax=Saccharothrix yanglingensis TaxID=659496 RepID=UPI0027D23829|nr:UDP-N-acetylglucosamine 2-epimerase [Saccharothrix yanglingensis]